MGVVRDVTIEQLTQAVGGIDTSGLVKDSTAQATNTILDNINTTLGGITTNDPPTDTTQQSIAAAISGLGQTLGSDRALIDGSNIANPSAFRSAIGISATNTPFTNTGTDIVSTNVQGAIEEINTGLKNIPSRLFKSQKQISFTMSKKTWNIGIFFGNVNGHGNFMGYLSVNANSIEYFREVGITPTWSMSYDNTTGNVTIGYESTVSYNFAYACIIGLI